MDLSATRWLTFDCYGTLIDWETGILGAVRPVLAPRGVDPTDAELLSRYAALEAEQERGEYRTYREVLRGVMAGLGRSFGVELSARELDSLPASLGNWPAFAETPGALTSLQRRFKLAVISNVDDGLFALTAPKLGVKLDALITAQQCRSYKPSLNNFRIALDRIGATPGQVLHIAESRYHDIAPARALGIRSVWVNRSGGGPSASGSADAAPDMEVHNLTALVARIGPA